VALKSLLPRITYKIITFTVPNKFLPRAHITHCEPFKNLKFHITSCCKGFCCSRLRERDHYDLLILSSHDHLLCQPYIYFKTCTHFCLHHLSGEFASYSYSSPSWISLGSQENLSNKTCHILVSNQNHQRMTMRTHKGKNHETLSVCRPFLRKEREPTVSGE
jgi:hypothetical protein